jgi:hypothetical protein
MILHNPYGDLTCLNELPLRRILRTLVSPFCRWKWQRNVALAEEYECQ